MISQDQIEEWIQEVEERPTSAPLIIQYISKRLRDLSARNEELLAENIDLRSGRKVEEYESRIANLEYQLEMLKRQFNGDIHPEGLQLGIDTISLLIYNPKGKVLRIEQPVKSLTSGIILEKIQDVSGDGPVRLLVTSQVEELLFVFDSGRTVSLPVHEIPEAEPQSSLEWSQAYLAEPRGGEELSTILPIARMSLYDYCIQTSRRGCAKKMMKSSFESHVSKNFVGAGIKSKPDNTCDLILTGKEDQLVLATREGFVCTLDVPQLPYTIEEVLKLGPTDYLVSSFISGKKPSLLIVTQNGKVIHRDASWLEKANSFKSRGQAVFSSSRREGGARVAGAAMVSPDDWSISVTSEGQLLLRSTADLINEGTLFSRSESSDHEAQVLEFITFEAQNSTQS